MFFTIYHAVRNLCPGHLRRFVHLAQLKAGDRVRFEKVSITTAQEALLAQRAALRCLRGAMNR